MKRIGKYQVLGLLGKGGMAKVYKIKVPGIEKIAALKRLDPDPMLVSLLGESSIREAFLAEAKTMANLRHPNVAAVWDYGESDGKPHFLMEYCCRNLGRMIGESYRPDEPSRWIRTDRAVDYVCQTLAGLHRLHEAGIVHRDVKPYNLLVTDDETIKLCDFGLSRRRGETMKTPENLKVGSPWYAAPEQENNPDDAGRRADLYSVGVLLYRMLAGALPPETGPIFPIQNRRDLADDWGRFFETALAPDPARRFADAPEMNNAVERLATRWREQMAAECPIDENETRRVRLPEEKTSSIRKSPVLASPKKAKKTFSLNRFQRPRVYTENDFELPSENTVLDRSTGRLWERGGTPFAVNREEADQYVTQKNAETLQGFSDWRLPTVDELLTLLTPPNRADGVCLEPVFEKTQKWLWSADRRSRISGWAVDTDLGFVDALDFDGFAHVKLVREATE